MPVPADPVHAFVDYPDAPVPHEPSGPLAGLTFAVKDIIDVAGYPTGCGSPEKTSDSGPAKAHAPIVSALLAAGAAFVGKTHTAELAFSIDGRNEHYGTPVNPKAPDRVPGGSSSGSAAAVAAGLVDFALGSDTGGSVRGPASFCGVIGHRPTIGRIDISGVMPLAPSLDTLGWFTRDAATYEKIGAVLLGDDVAGPPLTRIVIASDGFASMEGDGERDALAPAVARVTALLDRAEDVTVAPDGLFNWHLVYKTVQGREAWLNHGPWIEARKPALNPAVAVRFAAAKAVSAGEYDIARARREEIAKRVRGIVRDDTIIVLPAMPGIAPLRDASEESFEAFRTRAVSLNCIAGLAGCPQISLPLGTFNGAPLGLGLIAPPGRDRALIALARRILEA